MRALIGALGGFVLASAFMAGVTSMLVAAGWSTRADAVVSTGMLAFLLWAFAVLVAFGAGSVQRAAAWVLSLAAAFALSAWLSAAVMAAA